jgi:hypothetical protein
VRSNKHSLEGELTESARAAARPISGANVTKNQGVRRALPMLAAAIEGAE